MLNILIDPRFTKAKKSFKPTIFSYNIGETTVYSGRKVASTYLENIKNFNIKLPYREIYLIREPSLRFVSGIATSIFHFKSFFYKLNYTFDPKIKNSVSNFVSITANLFPEVYISDPHIHFYHNFLYDKFYQGNRENFKIIDVDKDDLSKIFYDLPVPNQTDSTLKEEIIEGLKQVRDSRAITCFNTILSLEEYYYRKMLKFR